MFSERKRPNALCNVVVKNGKFIFVEFKSTLLEGENSMIGVYLMNILKMNSLVQELGVQLRDSVSQYFFLLHQMVLSNT